MHFIDVITLRRLHKKMQDRIGYVCFNKHTSRRGIIQGYELKEDGVYYKVDYGDNYIILVHETNIVLLKDKKVSE